MFEKPRGKINNLDLEMAGLLLLWLCIKGISQTLEYKHIALFSGNTPTISWVERMVSRKSCIAAQLVKALALCLNIAKMCPLTPVRIPGVENPMTDIQSWSFGSNPEWHCRNDDKLLTLFNCTFPLPLQQSWTVFQFSTKNCYERDFRLADAGYYNGLVAVTAQNQKTCWNNLTAYVEPMGLDPYLQGVP